MYLVGDDIRTTDQLLDTFTEFKDAAYAMGHCQLSQATAAADRLESARKAFQTLFTKAVRDNVVSSRNGA